MSRKLLQQLIPALALVALASCGARDDAAGARNGEAQMGHATLSTIDLTSNAFANGQPIPAEYTCDGTDRSPPLSWSGAPPETKSFALVVDDPDAPNGTFRHWAAYDIPAGTHALPAGGTDGKEAENDFGKMGYGGPCPPRGHGRHHYRFKLFALDVEHLDVSARPKVLAVENAAARHAIARGELVGTYERR